MYIAGGAALHLLTGARVTEDIDASFSKRVLLNEDIEVSYRVLAVNLAKLDRQDHRREHSHVDEFLVDAGISRTGSR